MKHKQIISLLLLSLVSLSLSGQATDVEAKLESGYQKLNQKQYEASLEDFEQVLEADHTNFEAVIGRTSALLLLDRKKEAARYVDDGLKDFPGNPFLLYCRGLILNAKEQYKKAIPDFTAAIRAGNAEVNSRALISRGIAYQQTQNYKQAIADFTMAIEQSEEKINALYNRGFAYYQLGDYTDAISDFNRVIEADNDNAYAYYNLGMAYFRSNDKLNACKNFQEACQLGNKNACKMIMTECVNR